MRKSYWSKSSSWFPNLLWKQSFWKILCSLHTKHYGHEIRVSHSDGSLQVHLVTELMSDLIGRWVLIKTSMIHLQALFSTRLVGSADGCVRWERGQNHFVAGETKRSEVKSSKKITKTSATSKTPLRLTCYHLSLCVFTGIFELHFICALILCMFLVEAWKSEFHKTIKLQVSNSLLSHTNSEPIKTVRGFKSLHKHTVLISHCLDYMESYLYAYN